MFDEGFLRLAIELACDFNLLAIKASMSFEVVVCGFYERSRMERLCSARDMTHR